MVNNTLSRPSTFSISLSLPSMPLKSHYAKKISSLYDINYLKEEDKVQPTDFPTVNSYTMYKKTHFSLIKTIKALIQNTPKQVKEYI